MVFPSLTHDLKSASKALGDLYTQALRELEVTGVTELLTGSEDRVLALPLLTV